MRSLLFYMVLALSAAVLPASAQSPREDLGLVLYNGYEISITTGVTYTKRSPWNGVAVLVLTPQAWNQYNPAAEGGENAERPVLRIFVNVGYAEKVILKSEDKKTTLQPTGTVPCLENMVFGDKEDDLTRTDPSYSLQFPGPNCRGWEFPLDQVAKIRSLNKNGELQVTVVLAKETYHPELSKDFKVRRRHFDKLLGI